MECTQPASPISPREACLGEVEDSDVFVLLLGACYGGILPSGKSATHEEYEHARSLGKPVLVFIETVPEREPEQDGFLKEISGWQDGLFREEYTDPLDLSPKIVKALRRLGVKADSSSGDDPVEGLPPTCREGIEVLRRSSPNAAEQVLGLLCDPAYRRPGSLARLADKSPLWLADAGYTAWEVIGDFIDAHDLGDSFAIRRKAIDAGSPRSDLHLIQEAIVAAINNENAERAETLISQVSHYHYRLLTPVARACIVDNPTAAIEAVTSSDLHKSDDTDIALFSVDVLRWAYRSLEQLESERRVLQGASKRFPDRAGLLLLQAKTTFDMAHQVGTYTPAGRDLLNETAELAIRARDLYRKWDGPSYRAVVMAMRALLGLDDPPEGGRSCGAAARGGSNRIRG